MKTRIYSLILIQMLILVAILLCAGTVYQWVWAIASFVPATIVCLRALDKKYVVLSLLLLTVSQQGFLILVNSSWGFTYGSDSINDLHVASVVSESTHFTLGEASFTGRPAYSYYPLLHLFSVIMHNVSSIPLSIVALLFPFVSSTLTTVALYFINQRLFKLNGISRNFATLLFSMSAFYTIYDSQFIRETFAFPIVLLSLAILTKMDSDRNVNYAVAVFIFFVAITFSHHISSYIFFFILLIMALSLKIFVHSNRLFLFVLMLATLLGSYITFVNLSFSGTQFIYVFEGIQSIFSRGETVTVLKSSSSSWTVYIPYLYYVVFSILSLLGFVRSFRAKKRDWTTILLVGFFALAFVVCLALRLSTSADAWSWTYYMSLRGTIWSFLGISVLSAIGLFSFHRVSPPGPKAILVVVLLICILGAGKFAQFPSIVTDSSDAPMTYERYSAALWLKGATVHGSYMLVAPYRVDNDAFEVSREMAPYAYLKEYFLDNRTYTYDRFRGYVPFVAPFFDQYANSSHVQIIYSNGNTTIGYRP